MVAHLRTVALLVANPALSSILAGTLAGVPSLRVRPFEMRVALLTYLRLAPADLVVLDLDGDVDGLAEVIRDDAGIAARHPQIIALAGAYDAHASLRGCFDQVIVKPMSPLYLVERVLARLARTQPTLPMLHGAVRRDWSAFGDNVVPLFRDHHPPLH